MNLKHSQGLSNLLQDVISKNDVVLDLGSFASGTTQALLKTRCRCFVEDLPEFIQLMPLQSDAEFEESLNHHLIILSHNIKVDIILTWDLFHYFSLTQIDILFGLLKEKLKPGTIIHAVRHTTRTISKNPRTFKLHQDFSYAMTKSSDANTKDNIPHTTISLLQHLRHFNLYDTLTHTSELTKGIVEYSLCYGEQSEQHRKMKPIQIDRINLLNSKTYKKIVLPNLRKFLLSSVMNKLGRALDCSNPQVSNQAVLSYAFNEIIVEDLYSGMMWQKKFSSASSFNIGNQLINYHHSIKFDMVLLWDFFNYFDPFQMTLLLQKLIPHLKSGSILHFVMPHSRGAPDKPAVYRLSKAFGVDINGDLSGSGIIKTQTTGELVRLLTNFKVRSYYFGTTDTGENYQEFLFEYKG